MNKYKIGDKVIFIRKYLRVEKNVVGTITSIDHANGKWVLTDKCQYWVDPKYIVPESIGKTKLYKALF